MKKTKLGVILVLVMMLIMALVPMEASAATKTSKINLSSSVKTLCAGNNLIGINGSTKVTWKNGIRDSVTVSVPYCESEITNVKIQIKSNNGKTYSGSKEFDYLHSSKLNTLAPLVVKGPFFYNTKSIKVTINGTDVAKGKKSTWTIVNK